MDELDKRRRELASPSNDIHNLNEADFNDLSEKDIERMSLNYKFEKQLEEAVAIEVPENLADKILLKQTTQHPSNFFLYKSKLSIAASIALVMFIFLGTQTEKLTDIALAHVYHELDHLVETGSTVNADQVRANIKQLGFDLPGLPKNISYAGKCTIGNKQGMHIVVRVNNNPVTLFISSDRVDYKNNFSDNRFNGKIYPTKNGSIIIIGESVQDIEDVYGQTTTI
jgi:hypothetical protein